ncbi:preproneuropeptide B [Sarotherodon galilaeus]
MGQCVGRQQAQRNQPGHPDRHRLRVQPVPDYEALTIHDTGGLRTRESLYESIRTSQWHMNHSNARRSNIPPERRDDLEAMLRRENRSFSELMVHKDFITQQLTSIFEPEVETESGKISYRFKCPGSGLFQCSLTGLVFDMTQEVEVLYRIIQWDQSILQSTGKTAAGPLFEIKGCEDVIRQLHFPHCETDEAVLSDDSLSVINFSDDGFSVLQPLKITDTHVIVEVSHLSAFGLIWDFIKRFLTIKNPVKGQVLLFVRATPMGAQTQNLDVFLLPCNVPLHEVKAQHPHSAYIPVPSNCKLIKNETYTVLCPTARKIQPKKAEFDMEFGPNYYATFEIRFDVNTEEVTVTVQDQTNEEVWEHDIDMAVVPPSPPVSCSSCQMLHQKSVPQSRMLPHPGSPDVNVAPKLKVSTELLEMLNDLDDGDFDTFKWHLKSELWKNIKPIQENKLTKAERHAMVDLMVQKYEISGAVEVMESVLLKISRNDLVEKLRLLTVDTSI